LQNTSTNRADGSQQQHNPNLAQCARRHRETMSKATTGLKIRDRITELRRVRASELVPNPKNFRRHPKEQSAALKGLLAEIGYADALIARELPDGRLVLLDGHLRAETTPTMEVPVLVLDVTEEEGDKILLTLDPLASMAEADKASVEALLETVRTDDAAVAAMLERIAGESAWQVLNDRQVEEVPAQIDKAGELKAKWGTAPGQAWEAGPHRRVCGDCREKATVARLCANGARKIRLVWTDAPYGVNLAAKNERLNRTDRGGRVQRPIIGDDLKPEEVGALFCDALCAIEGRTDSGSAIYATVPSGKMLPVFIEYLELAGWTYKACLVWVKNQFVIGAGDYHWKHASILYGWKEDGAHYFVNDRTQSSVFEVDKPHVSDTHPAQKPVELVARMIANSSKVGEIIYDPFLGSGTTLVAAHQLGRVGFGVEISPEYLAVSLQRLADLGLEPKLIDG
jgi:DNA modification methylase